MQQVKARLIALALMHCFIFVGCSHSKSALEDDEIPKIRVAIVGTNDVEGAVKSKVYKYESVSVQQGGLALLNSYLRAIRQELSGNILLLDAGDIYQGSLESNLNKGRVMIRAYNHLGYDAAAVGNHEFDFGALYNGGDTLGVVRKRIGEAKFPFLSANIVRKENQKPLNWRNLYRWKVIEKGGLRFGVVGLSTPSTMVTTNPEYIREIEVAPMRAALEEALAAFAKAKTHANVLVTHEGGMKEGEPLNELLADLPKNSLHAVVSGHWHSFFADRVHGIPVLQAGDKAKNIGRVDLIFNAATKEFLGSERPRLIPVCEKYFSKVDDCSPFAAKKFFAKDGEEDWSKLLPLREVKVGTQTLDQEDKKLNHLLSSAVRKANQYRKKRLAYIARPLRRSKRKESEVGELFLQALRSRFKDVDVILLNGGGFRKDIGSGAFTYGDLFEVYPFDNSLVVVRMKGSELKGAIRILTSGAGPWTPVVDGVQVSYKKEVPEAGMEDWNGDGKVEIWEHNRLARLTREDGSAIEDEDELSVLTIDFLVNGGDNLGHVFSQIDRSRIRVMRGTEVREEVLAWLRKNRRPINSSRNPILSSDRRRIFPIP